MIDAVITWVDGDEPAHVAKRKLYQSELGVHPDATSATRFSSSGEIRFAVQSILRFCPFVGKIHIVTDNQYPEILRAISEDPKYRERIFIVDHRAIYREHADLLPVFSSRSIETMIHRTPGLSSRFIYFNDDIFVGRPLEETHFFDGERAVLRGRMRRFPNRALSALKRWIGRDRPGYAAAQRAAARLIGSTSHYFLTEHQPHPMHRDLLADFYANDQEALRKQAGYRFRSSEQFSPIGLSNHLAITAGARVTPPLDVGYIRPGRPTGVELKKVLAQLKVGDFASFCVQSLDSMPEKDREVILNDLFDYYGHH